jgi:hypothetical protein
MPEDIHFHRDQFPYTALFCEENIWQLANSLKKHTSLSDMWVLFFSNPAFKVPLLNQQVAYEGEVIIWDYHTVLLANVDGQYNILDFDTCLPFATVLRDYIEQTVHDPKQLPRDLIPYVRKVPASNYLKNFFSDRSHMTEQIALSEFPPWPVINLGKANTIKLSEYINVLQFIDDGSSIIKVCSREQLITWLTEIPAPLK